MKPSSSEPTVDYLKPHDLTRLSSIIQGTVVQESYDNSYLKLLRQQKEYQSSIFDPLPKL